MVPASTDGPPGGSGGEPPGRQRWEFVGAFVEHSWTRPGTDRSSAKPQLLLTMATVSAVLALGAGVVLQLVNPIPLAAAAPAPTPSKASTTTFSAVAGWDCPATAIAGFEATGRQSTWRTIAAGGWPNDGCHGTFEVLPLNGLATSEVNAPSAVWWFRPACRRPVPGGGLHPARDVPLVPAGPGGPFLGVRRPGRSELRPVHSGPERQAVHLGPRPEPIPLTSTGSRWSWWPRVNRRRRTPCWPLPRSRSRARMSEPRGVRG